jgi:hypothetical protein
MYWSYVRALLDLSQGHGSISLPAHLFVCIYELQYLVCTLSEPVRTCIEGTAQGHPVSEHRMEMFRSIRMEMLTSSKYRYLAAQKKIDVVTHGHPTGRPIDGDYYVLHPFCYYCLRFIKI